MANRGYDVVVDVDAEGDLGHTDLQEDLEFHSSNFETSTSTRGKLPPGNSSFLPTTTNNSSTNPSVTSSKHYLWSISFYAQFFDVDTSEVARRCRAAIFPLSNFLDVLDGNPDLYGPFWIATTVVVILFLTGTISQYLAKEGKKHFIYDFTLLSGAAGLIYGYTFFIPVALWGALRWFRAESANLLECICLYGYANLIWIPVALISWSPVSILNWVFVAVGLAASGVFLVRNLYPVLSATDVKTSKILLVVVVGLHFGLALAIKILFFAHGSPVKKDKAPKGDDDKATRMLFGL
ncbi:Yip1-domain-containing protein [Aureobasidium sp. EXF-8845]|nr:Yip1-domain-containing protein [Aureobasidium sp. EXF-8845]KAI4834395.1 Yip1-domain-containing protein [Aureobasidium sp. EXF-8846]